MQRQMSSRLDWNISVTSCIKDCHWFIVQLLTTGVCFIRLEDSTQPLISMWSQQLVERRVDCYRNLQHHLKHEEFINNPVLAIMEIIYMRVKTEPLSQIWHYPIWHPSLCIFCIFCYDCHLKMHWIYNYFVCCHFYYARLFKFPNCWNFRHSIGYGEGWSRVKYFQVHITLLQVIL